MQKSRKMINIMQFFVRTNPIACKFYGTSHQDYCVRHVAALLGGGGGGDGEDDENPFYNWRGPGGEGEEGDSLVMREETAAQEIRRHERNTFFQVLFFLLCNLQT